MLVFAFLLATSALLLQGVLVPGISLFAYAPWIALVTLKRPLIRALWLSAAGGLCLDLLSDHPFGIHALAFAATSMVLFRLRKHFSAEDPLHLGLYSSLVSFVGTLTILFLLFLFDRRVPFAGIWIFGDLIAMPIVDGIYAAIWFAGPLALFVKMRRQWMLFWLKRKNPSLTSR